MKTMEIKEEIRNTTKKKKVNTKVVQMRKEIAVSILLAWDSLQSHLDATAEEPKHKDIIGDRNFHWRAIRDYHYIMGTLIDNLKR